MENAANRTIRGVFTFTFQDSVSTLSLVTSPSHWRHDRVFWLILGIAALLALAYNGAVLIGFGPDETRHMNYIKLLLDAHQLPVIEDASAAHYRETGGAHAFHPPLYHLLLLPFYAVFRVLPDNLAWHLTRAVSSFFCLGALPLLYEIALAASRRRAIALLAVASVAFTPMFGMTTAIINNDSAALFFTSLFLYLLTVRFAARRDFKSALILGAVLGLGGLCKATVLLCGGIAVFITLWTRREIKSPASWKAAFLTLGVGALLVSPWHIRSFLLYGTWTPLPPSMPWFNPPLHGFELLAHPDFPTLLLRCNVSLFTTLWSQRDWLMQRQTEPIGIYEMPQTVIYCVLAAFCTSAVLGHIISLKKAAPADSLEAKTARFTSYGAFALTWLTVLQVALSYHQGWAEGGRYLLPSFIGLSLFLSCGFAKLLPDPAALKKFGALWLALLLGLNGAALYWLLAFLNPTYGPK